MIDYINKYHMIDFFSKFYMFDFLSKSYMIDIINTIVSPLIQLLLKVMIITAT